MSFLLYSGSGRTMIRKHGQTWHYIIEQLIKDKDEVNPKELSLLIEGIHPQKIASILRSLGWIRVSDPIHNDIILYYRP